VPDYRRLDEIAAQDPLAVALLGAGVVVMTIVMVVAIRRRAAADSGLAAQERIEAIRRAAAAFSADREEDHRSSDRRHPAVLAASLDRSAGRLQRLLDDAETRIAELRALLDATAETTDRPQATPTARPLRMVSPPLEAEDDSSAAIERDGERPVDPAGERPPVRPPAEPRPRRETSAVIESSPRSGPADPLSDRVYALADAGRSAREIARELGTHQGRVELVLALRAV